jgi:Domain of unknown function (DUF4116)
VRKSGALFDHIGQELKNDTKFVTTIVTSYPLLFQFLNEDFRNNKYIARIAFFGMNFAEYNGKDKNTHNTSCMFNFQLLQYAGIDIKNDAEIVGLLLSRYHRGCLLQYAGDELRNNRNFCLKVITTQWLEFRHISEELKNNQEFLSEVLDKNSHVFSLFDEKFQHDTQLGKIAVSKNPLMFKYVSPVLQDDENFCLHVLKEAPHEFKHISQRLQNNLSFLIKAVKTNGLVFVNLKEEWRNNKELAEPAITQYGFNLQYAGADIKNNKNIVLAAIQQDILELDNADFILLNDQEFMAKACAINPKAKYWLPTEMKSNPVFLQWAGISSVFVWALLFGLSASLIALAVGVLMLAHVITAPMVIGAVITTAGLSCSSFFAYKIIKHQMQVADFLPGKDLKAEQKI